MPQNTHLEIISAESERLPGGSPETRDLPALCAKAQALAHSLSWLPSVSSSRTLLERWRKVRDTLRPLVAALERPLEGRPVSNDFRWLHDNVRMLYAELADTAGAIKRFKKIPHVRTRDGQVVPRVVGLAEGFLRAAEYQFSEEGFTAFFAAFQETTVLEIAELWALVPALELVLLEEIAARGHQLVKDPSSESCDVGPCIRSLRDVAQTTWKDALEPLILVDHILREDPADSYLQMDFDSRDLYRTRLAAIAEHSDFSEMEVARQAVELAEEARRRRYDDPRVALRESHVGYYLLDKGATLLYERVGFQPSLGQQIQIFFRKHPDEIFLPGIEILTFAIMSAVVLLLSDPYNSPGFILVSMLVLLLACSQSAVQLINSLTTAVLPPQILPKLDFSDGVPDDCMTMVAVPSLLFNEKQVRGLVEDLEVRFLGNRDSNLRFALLTDLPDSREPASEDSPLVDLCADLIRELNEKYGSRTTGPFFFFHRHRTYNPRERAWMGWERKRGKLMDLNRLLRGQYDNFPVKVGNLSILSQVRFVITLDSDTELPRGSARRMIGALAHPLNQAIIDPDKHIVVAGYGILQPRVGVSVQSTVRSRLAAIYAGETGFDIYTRAVSDAYQDLYGEGSFTGKGIYEVDTVYRVLERRFPRNALLSHDLIEGAYVRAGLVSDIEVIEDYPSHYSAYNRRKHRWLRGDWQISAWLFPHVVDETGARVANPISLISWWKILDNLRRSLVEPATFVLFVFGWLVVSRAHGYWTLAAVGILLLPPCGQFLLSLLRAAFTQKLQIAREAPSVLFASLVNIFLTLVFLAHQTLVSLDAVVRALVRRLVTRRRLLEWETAAEAELGAFGRTPVDRYLDWTPGLGLGLGLLVWVTRPDALPAALPVLLLWTLSKLVSLWLNRPPVAPRNEVSEKDRLFLRQSALRTWRYFAAFSTEEHNWLIPDNVQEEPAAIAPRVSPTNLGLLLNARQVACEFGYLTVAEFAEQTLRTLGTVAKLRKHRGHLLNWYDTRSLRPLPPLFVSSVDSGNLLASLWTLQHGCLEQLQQPILRSQLSAGLLDSVRALVELDAFRRKQLSALERQLSRENWLQGVFSLSDSAFDSPRPTAVSQYAAEVRWFQQEARSRLRGIQKTIEAYLPWCLPEFSALPKGLVSAVAGELSLQQLPGFLQRLDQHLDAFAQSSAPEEQRSLAARLREKLSAALTNALRLIEDIRKVAADAGKIADEMDFSFLLNPRRKLMSVGFDVDSHELHSACYDLLATESRTAVFAAIAKNDIPQESWFLLGRAHTLDHGRAILLSWTGTLFEYLMPALWMHTYANTLLERSRAAAVNSQRAYTSSKNIPWGISESAYFKVDDAGNYQYHAFGLPHLALRKSESDALVISPYSTFLALNVDPAESLRNLHRMADMEWLAAYGFYEAADYSSSRPGAWRRLRYRLVKCWMAHHQGMSLIAVANLLRDNVVQRWFHRERRVQATELLLHEKPLAHVRPIDRAGRTITA